MLIEIGTNAFCLRPVHQVLLDKSVRGCKRWRGTPSVTAGMCSGPAPMACLECVVPACDRARRCRTLQEPDRIANSCLDGVTLAIIYKYETGEITRIRDFSRYVY